MYVMAWIVPMYVTLYGMIPMHVTLWHDTNVCHGMDCTDVCHTIWHDTNVCHGMDCTNACHTIWHGTNGHTMTW